MEFAGGFGRLARLAWAFIAGSGKPVAHVAWTGL